MPLSRSVTSFTPRAASAVTRPATYAPGTGPDPVLPDPVKRMIPKATLLQFETQDDAKLEVINGKVDAFVYDLPYNAIFASQNTGAVVHLDKPFTFEPLAWAIRKGDQDTLNWFNNYLRQIKGDGSYDRLYKKWFESNAWLNQLK